ncbi:DUF3618 domain-containing protein [Roseovarius nanhaiticus]|uniref:DUF3618 domain-containing protein n=1 Tax=Roseovarius nanhaiticus TaxID=573024 RepID=UPI002490AF48|nr:DUF3618 domain-containing protein [Roseovarius nanhaiticus]
MTNDTRSSEEIEREIERERAGLKDSIHDLQDRLSFDGMFQQVGDQLREHGGEFGRSIAKSARDNPVALALTGAGLAWLMFGNNRRSDRREDRYPDDRYRAPAGAPGHLAHRGDQMHARSSTGVPDDAARRGTFYEGPKTPATGRPRSQPSWARAWERDELEGHSSGGTSGVRSSVADAAGTARDKVVSGSSSAAGAVSSAAGSMRDTASDTASSASDSASHVARNVRDSAGNMWSSASQHASAVQQRLREGTENLSEEARDRIAAARARAIDARDEAGRRLSRGADQATDFYDEHPLVVGALAFAVGAAFAGALPRTRVEDNYVGSYSDDLYDEAERIYAEEVEKARKVVKAGVDEAKTVASDLEGDARDAAKSAADKAKSAAEQVADATKEEAQDERLGDVKDDAKKN